jgi:hypothetical protein
VDFWQQYQGFVWVGLLVVVLPAVGFLLKRRVGRVNGAMRERAVQQSDPAFVAGQAAARAADTSDALSVALTFAASAEQVASHLSGMKLPAFWIQSAATQWQTPLSKSDPTPAAIVVLEPVEQGSRLALARADQLGDVVTTQREWDKIRANALKAARAAAIPVSEGVGPTLAVVATVNTTGTSLESTGLTRHRWERVGG